MRLPHGASRWASEAPPGPVPITMRSYRSELKSSAPLLLRKGGPRMMRQASCLDYALEGLYTLRAAMLKGMIDGKRGSASANTR